MDENTIKGLEVGSRLHDEWRKPRKLEEVSMSQGGKLQMMLHMKNYQEIGKKKIFKQDLQ